MTVYRRIVAVAAFVLLGDGCQPEVTCLESGAACGGDPTASGESWTLSGACRDPVFVPPVQVTYLGQPVQMARQPSPMPASSDWCSSLVLGTAGITSFQFPHDTLNPAGAQISYCGDVAGQAEQGSYHANVNTTGSGSIDLSHECLARTGMSLSCDAVAAALTIFAQTKPDRPGVPCTDSPADPGSCQFFYSYGTIDCQVIPGGGCRCTYPVSFTGKYGGRWKKNGTVLTHSDTSKMLPSQADYCVQGDKMTLSGHDRASILNFAGMRTMSLDRVVAMCGNGLVECGEECDPPDQMFCDSTCRATIPP